jgi:hypothetical protein
MTTRLSILLSLFLCSLVLGQTVQFLATQDGTNYFTTVPTIATNAPTLAKVLQAGVNGERNPMTNITYLGFYDGMAINSSGSLSVGDYTLVFNGSAMASIAQVTNAVFDGLKFRVSYSQLPGGTNYVATNAITVSISYVWSSNHTAIIPRATIVP